MVIWLIESSRSRHRLIDPSFRPCFYVEGPEARLSRLARTLEARAPVSCSFTEKTCIWGGQPQRVLEVSVRQLLLFSALVRFVRRQDNTLRLYNSDLMLASVYCWEKQVFPLAQVEVEADETGKIRALTSVDDEWAIDYERPPLTLMQVHLEGRSVVNPRQGGWSGAIEVEVEGERQVLDDSDQPAVVSFERLMRVHDPDVIVSEWGDAVLFPALLRQARRCKVPLRLNREARPVERRRARSYVSYGRILFKESTTTLLGRLHVDGQNSFIAGQCELEGLWELARITKLPVQYAARTTTGTGISYMQMELAYRDGVLIPEQKAEPETPKHPDELLCADRGGLVFVPKLGFTANVAELDFVSQFPSIMARFNISPETVNCPCCPDAPRIPELGYRICEKRRGITSRVVERLIAKRSELKKLQKTSPPDAALRFKLQRDSMKWLLVCCFGYTGYKNARFGKIEAHEAINAVARETLLVAKEIAEADGFELIHALVDSLYVWKDRATREEYERLTREIEKKTRLPLAIESVYRYVVFLPSKQYADVPVPNRFFAVGEDGELKVRGLECRRHDTPPLLKRMQHEVLAILAEAHDFESYVCR